MKYAFQKDRKLTMAELPLIVYAIVYAKIESAYSLMLKIWGWVRKISCAEGTQNLLN